MKLQILAAVGMVNLLRQLEVGMVMQRRVGVGMVTPPQVGVGMVTPRQLEVGMVTPRQVGVGMVIPLQQVGDMLIFQIPTAIGMVKNPAAGTVREDLWRRGTGHQQSP